MQAMKLACSLAQHTARADFRHYYDDWKFYKLNVNCTRRSPAQYPSNTIVEQMSVYILDLKLQTPRWVSVPVQYFSLKFISWCLFEMSIVALPS